MITRRAVMTGASALALGSSARAQSAPRVKIGVLTDMSGVLSSVLGTGSVDGARMAIEDFSGTVAGMPVDLVFADHQNRPDVASALARRWIDEEQVDVITDLGQSACAIAVQQIVREKNKVIIVTGAASSDLTGRYCNRNSFHWGYDTYMQSAAIAGELTRTGGDTWFFITVDYAYGHTLEADARRKIEQAGGRVVGSVRHPANAHDFSSFLLQAQTSGAKVIGLATPGGDLEKVIRQGAEFGVWRSQRAVAFPLQLYNVPAIGLDVMQGILHNSIFYWYRSDETRAFARRFWQRNNRPPSEAHAISYSGASQYLKAIRAAGTKDTDAVLRALHELPVADAVTPSCTVRRDGRLLRPTYLVQVKQASEVREPWDYFSIVSEIPGDQAYRPLSESECPLVRT